VCSTLCTCAVCPVAGTERCQAINQNQLVLLNTTIKLFGNNVYKTVVHAIDMFFLSLSDKVGITFFNEGL